MKTLLESILDDIDVQMQHGDEFQKYADKFGHYFVFNNCECHESIAGLFSASTLKSLTKGLPYYNEKIENGQFDSRNKIKMFANWLDQTNLIDIGVKFTELNSSNLSDKEWRREFGKKIEKYCIENNIFNKPDKAHIFTNTGIVRKDSLTIFIVHMNNPGRAIRLDYKINYI